MPNQTSVVEVNKLMAELRETNALLRESEATFRAVIDVSSVGKIEVDPRSARFLRGQYWKSPIQMTATATTKCTEA
jgi:hypothetical protein